MLYTIYCSDEFLTKFIDASFQYFETAVEGSVLLGYCTPSLVIHCPIGLNVQEEGVSKFIKLNFWSKLALY